MKQIVLGFLVIWGCLPAIAKTHVSVTLTSDHEVIELGKPFQFAAHISLEDHWHVYWQNPGSSGLPTTVTWEEVPGLEISALQYPVPKQFIDSGFITYGYDEEAILLADAVYSGDEKVIKVKGLVEWLECKELCVPGSEEITLTLDVGTAKQTRQDWFRSARALIPLAHDTQSPLSYQTSFEFSGDRWTGHLTFKLSGGHKWSQNDDDFAFFPGVNEHAELKSSSLKRSGDTLNVTLTYMAWEETVPPDLALTGVLKTSLDGAPKSFELPIYPAVGQQGMAPPIVSSDSGPAQVPWSLWVILGFAFIGGMLLNLMPCVLPVLSLKILSFIEEAGESTARRVQFGLVYTFGVMVSFLVFSIIIIAFKLGVGFQFQDPYFVIFMSVLLFVMGLSFFGVFEFGTPNSDAVNDLAQKRGVSGAFYQGMLMTLLATPCTAPFLGTAYGFALTAPTWQVITVFQVVALGLALPYLAISSVPFLIKFIPKPGPWMNQFKISMGFLLMGTVVWLISILNSLTGNSGVIGLLALLVALGMALWIYGQSVFAERPLRYLLTALAVTLFGAWISMFVLFDLRNPFGQKEAQEAYLRLKFMSEQEGGDGLLAALENQKTTDDKIAWIPFTDQNLEHFRSQNRLVFMDFTADWCNTCKVNEALVIDTDDVRRGLQDKDVVTIKVDYTERDDKITEMLKSFGRGGVPLYVVYPGQLKPIVLPETITKSMVLNALSQAETQLQQRSSL